MFIPMKTIVKLLLTTPLFLNLMNPHLFSNKDTLSPRSITQNSYILKALKGLQNGTITQETLLQDAAALDERSSDAVTKELILSGSILNIGFELEHRINQLKQALTQNPQNHVAIEEYMTTWLLLESRTSRPRSELIQQYLNYYLAVRNSDHPFNLIDLHKSISPEDLLQYIEDNYNDLGKIAENQATLIQPNFVFAEMIRRLKLGPSYSKHTWSNDEKSYLHKKNFWKYIFNDILAGYQNDTFKTFIKMHLYSTDLMTPEQKKTLLRSLTMVFMNFDFRYLYFTFSDVPYHNMAIFDRCDFDCSHLFFKTAPLFQLCSFREATLRGKIKQSDFANVDLCGANLADTQFTNIDPDLSLRDKRTINGKTTLPNQKFPSWFFTRVDLEEGKSLSISEYKILEELMKQKNLSLKKLAEQLGVKEGKIKNLQENWNPSRSFLEDIAEALGVSPEVFQSGNLPALSNPTAVETAL